MTLPGDLTREEKLARLIRVDHAGEYGAKRIYDGQLAILKLHPKSPIIRHMAEQEQVHLDAFSALMREHRVRPTLLAPLWHVAGFALGAASALLGEKAAMACTVAVEDVIDAHYAEQEKEWGENAPELCGMISQFRADERAHRDTGIAHGAEAAPGYNALYAVVSRATRAAIWLSSRI